MAETLNGRAWCLVLRLIAPLALVAAAAGAQESGVVRGAVTDAVTARPVVGAIVRLTVPIPGALPRVTRTDETGAFVFVKVPLGRVAIDFRRLGYEMARQSVDVSARTDPVSVKMTRLTTLDTIRVAAAKQGLIGVVGTSSDLRPLPNASVKLTGFGASQVKLDSTAHFFIPIKTVGTYVLRATAPGFHPQTMSVIVSPNEGVEIAFLLDSAPNGVSNKFEMAFAEMDDRFKQRGLASALVPRTELLKDPNGGLLNSLMYAKTFGQKGLRWGDEACVFIDGIPRPGMAVNGVEPAEIEAVELYGPTAERTRTLVTKWPKNAPCGSTGMPRTQPGGNVVKWVAIWLKR